MEIKLKYNYVFMFARYDYDRAILPQCDGVKILTEGISGSKLCEKFFHLHWAHSLNNKFYVPFKQLWFPKMYDQHFDNDLPICFVYIGPTMEFDSGFCDYVRRKDPRNRQILIHEDLIAKEIGTPEKYNKIKSKFDLCTSYDEAEATKYGIPYFRRTVYNKLLNNVNCQKFEYDVLFVGAAKNRLKRIMNAYYRFHNLGLKCKFIIAGVKEKDRISAEDISYDYIPYLDNLKYVIKSRCLLEIIQEGSVDITIRAVEAIAYGRKLITDCKIDLTPMFNSGQLLAFDNVENIDREFIIEEYDPAYFIPKIDLDTRQRLYFIQDKLENRSTDGQ